MKKTWGSNREKAISVLELIAFIVQAVFLVIVLVSYFDTQNQGITYSEEIQSLIDQERIETIIAGFIQTLIYLPYLMVAVRNFKTKQSNNEKLIVIFGSFIVILHFFPLISSLSNISITIISLLRLIYNVVGLAYHVVLVVLVVQQLREKRGINGKGAHAEFRYQYNVPDSSAQIPKQKCGHCGSDIDSCVKFCEKCGAPVSENKTEPFQYK